MIEPVVTEYRLQRGYCAGCGITTRGVLPQDVPSGQCGPRLAAFVGLLMGHFRQSKRRAVLGGSAEYPVQRGLDRQDSKPRFRGS